MQTRPVAALTLGTEPGSTRTIDRMMKKSGRIALNVFTNIHYPSIRVEN